MAKNSDFKYGGYTLQQLKEIIEASEETESSIDDLCGGDLTTSRIIIQDLISDIELLTEKK